MAGNNKNKGKINVKSQNIIIPLDLKKEERDMKSIVFHSNIIIHPHLMGYHDMHFVIDCYQIDCYTNTTFRSLFFYISVNMVKWRVEKNI